MKPPKFTFLLSEIDRLKDENYLLKMEIARLGQELGRALKAAPQMEMLNVLTNDKLFRRPIS